MSDELRERLARAVNEADGLDHYERQRAIADAILDAARAVAREEMDNRELLPGTVSCDLQLHESHGHRCHALEQMVAALESRLTAVEQRGPIIKQPTKPFCGECDHYHTPDEPHHVCELCGDRCPQPSPAPREPSARWGTQEMIHRLCDKCGRDWWDTRAFGPCECEINAPTDTQRIDFLNRQTWTRWVGYDTASGGHMTWPVFKGDDFRAEVDRAMRAARFLKEKP